MTRSNQMSPWRAKAARACIAALAVVAFGPAPSQATEPEKIRAVMQDAQASLRTLLIQSTNPGGLHSRPNAEASIEAIANLYDVGTSLQFHMQGDEARYMADVLAYQAWWMGLAFNLEQMGVIEALAHEMTNVCVACHTRLPDVRDTSGADAFLPESKLTQLGTIQRARLEVATRRFEPALARLEKYALSEEVPWPEVERAAVLHMTVSVRVMHELAAPRRLVAALATRSPLPADASDTISAWTESLQHVSLDVPVANFLPTARALVHRAGGQAAAPTRSQHKLVEFLVASSMLNRLLLEPATRPAETAEASYLLGLSYSRVGNLSHVSLAAFHLERAVKMTPNALWAQPALRELEAVLLDMFGAANREDLPQDALEDFEALEGLVGA